MRSIALVLFAAGIISQVMAPGDWTHMASLPFAFAAASFLIWSMVQLFRVIFDSYKQQTADTTTTLREQVANLRKFQDDTLVDLITRVSTAMERDAESANASVSAWRDVHEDFRSLIGALEHRPCLHDSDFDRFDSAGNKASRKIEQRSG